MAVEGLSDPWSKITVIAMTLQEHDPDAKNTTWIEKSLNVTKLPLNAIK